MHTSSFWTKSSTRPHTSGTTRPARHRLAQGRVDAGLRRQHHGAVYPGTAGTISGVIRRVEIKTAVGDGSKLFQRCEDLVIGQFGVAPCDGAGGYIHGWEKRGDVHQDMVQVQGGKRCRIRNVQMFALTEGGASHAVFLNGPDDPRRSRTWCSRSASWFAAPKASCPTSSSRTAHARGYVTAALRLGAAERVPSTSR